MENNSFYFQYQDELKKLAKDISNQSITGGCKSFDEYRYQCGMVAGLNEAVVVLTEMVKKRRDQEDV